MKIEEALRIAAGAKVRPRRRLAIASLENEGAEPTDVVSTDRDAHGHFRTGSKRATTARSRAAPNTNSI
jgi:hypothetical protein